MAGEVTKVSASTGLHPSTAPRGQAPAATAPSLRAETRSGPGSAGPSSGSLSTRFSSSRCAQGCVLHPSLRRPDTARGTFPKRKGQAGQQRPAPWEARQRGVPSPQGWACWGQWMNWEEEQDDGRGLAVQTPHGAQHWGRRGLEEPAGLDGPHSCLRLVGEAPWWPSLKVPASERSWANGTRP